MKLYLSLFFSLFLFGAGARTESVVELDKASVPELWSHEGSTLEQVTEGGETMLRWTIPAGKSVDLAMRPDNPLFSKLRYFDWLELEFRVVKGAIDQLELRAQGHVSGTRRTTPHQWNLGIITTPRHVWQRRQIDLTRPNWFPWNNVDGTPPWFGFGALALEPETVIELRRVRLTAQSLVVKPAFERPITWPVGGLSEDGSAEYTFEVSVQNYASKPTQVHARVGSDHEYFAVSVEPQSVPLKAGEQVVFKVQAKATAASVAKMAELASETVCLIFTSDAAPEVSQSFEMPITRPLSPGRKAQFIFPENLVSFLRQKMASASVEDQKALASLKLREMMESANRFLEIRLDQIPGGFGQHVSNRWPTVPGSNPARKYEIGSVMPEIVDPETGVREIGTPLATSVWNEYLGNSERVTENLGFAYLITGDEKYAAKAVELMEVYARQYQYLPFKTMSEAGWGSGPAILSSSRPAAGSTYGTNWLFRYHLRMLGLINGSASFTPEARERIYKGFVLPYATELMKFPGGISNMTDITNTNLLVLGLTFDDANLVRWALLSEPGLISRLSDLDADGFSSEGRPLNYHSAAMDEYLPGLRFLEQSGLKVDYPKERLLATIRMPFLRASLWGVVPNSGDCGRGGHRVGTSMHADVLGPIFPDEAWLQQIGRNASFEAKVRRLMDSAPVDPRAFRHLLESKPRLFREAGLAILRSGDTPETQIMATLDYGRNPMHAHLDRNQVTLAAFGKTFTHGPGTLYNAGSGGITRSSDAKLNAFCAPGSLGQNVVMVDAQNQRPAIGTLVDWSDAADDQFVIAKVDGIAPGVSHTRTLILRDGILILRDDLEADSERTFDFLYHNLGDLSLGKGWAGKPVPTPLAKTANSGVAAAFRPRRGPLELGSFHAIYPDSERSCASSGVNWVGPLADRPPRGRRVHWSHWDE